MQKWMTWMQGLAEKGPSQGSRAIPWSRAERLVSGTSKTVTDGPYAEKDLVGGFKPG